MIESINNNWSKRELERQINSILYERIALSKNKEKVKELSIEGQVIQSAGDIIKDPYVFEFLGLKENEDYLEKDLEKALLNKLQYFFLNSARDFLLWQDRRGLLLTGIIFI